MSAAETISPNYYEKWAEVYDLIYGKYQIDLPFYAQAAKNAGGKVLEVACGTGRVYLELLKHGVDAYGVDISGPMLKVLERKAATLSLQPRVQPGDMRDFKMNYKFSLIIIPFRAFLHNLTIEDQLQTLKNCRRHLSPEGKLMLNFFCPNPEIIANNYGKDIAIRLDTPKGLIERVSRSHFINEPDQVIEVTDTLKKEGRAFWSITFKLCLIYKKEFELLLKLAGFSQWKVFGGFDYQALDSNKQEMVWVIDR